MTQQPLLDVEQAFVGYLLASLPGMWSCLELPPVAEFNARLPIVQAIRIGGVATRSTWGNGYLLDVPTISVDVYAGSREQANTTVALVRRAVLGIGGHTRDGVAFVAAAEISGPGWRPDASQNITRIGWSVALTVRPSSQ